MALPVQTPRCDVPVCVKLTRPLLELIDAEAKRKLLSRSDVIRQRILQSLEGRWS